MNIASIIIKVWTLTKLWCPNFVQAEEMHWINRSIGQALEENAKRNDDLRRYREALEEVKAFVCGEAVSKWGTDSQTTKSRIRIANTCDVALLNLK